MGVFVDVIVLIITFGTFVTAGGFATNAAVRVTQIPNYSENPDLSAAHSKLSWAAVLTWITVALLIVGVILYFVFLSETAEVTGKWVVIGIIGVCLLGSIGVGVLSAIAASDISKAQAPNDAGSYHQAIVATVLALVVSFLLLVTIILRLVYKPKKKSSSSNLEGLLGGNMPDFFTNALEDDPELAEAAL